MRIVKSRSNDGSWCFLIYAVSCAADGLVADMVRRLRREKLPVLIGGPQKDPSRLLTVGPLNNDQAYRFSLQWGHYVEDAADSA